MTENAHPFLQWYGHDWTARRDARSVHGLSARSARDHDQWLTVSNTAPGETEIRIYDEIGIWGVTASDFRAAVRGIPQSNAIALHINSPGGDVFDGIAIYSTLRQHPGTVTAYVDGLAASAASFIALAADRVIIARHAQMMIHDAWGIAMGNADVMLEAAAFLERQTGIIAEIYAERAGGELDGWRDLMAEETWFTDAEAVSVGLAHEIGGADLDAVALVRDRFDLSIFRNHPDDDSSDAGDPPVATHVSDEWRMDALIKIADAELEVLNADAH